MRKNLQNKILAWEDKKWPSFLYDLDIADPTGKNEYLGFLQGHFIVRVFGSFRCVYKIVLILIGVSIYLHG